MRAAGIIAPPPAYSNKSSDAVTIRYGTYKKYNFK